MLCCVVCCIEAVYLGGVVLVGYILEGFGLVHAALNPPCGRVYLGKYTGCIDWGGEWGIYLGGHKPESDISRVYLGISTIVDAKHQDNIPDLLVF